MSGAAYETLPGLRWSVAKEGLSSALHLQHRLAVTRDDTQAFRVGRLADTAILDPATFDAVVEAPAEFVTEKGALSTAKPAKAWLETLPAGSTVATAAEIHAANRMRDAVLRHPVASQWLDTTTLRHHALTWTDGAIACKAEYDAVCGSSGLAWDLKTTQGRGGPVSVRACLAAICAYAYHGQFGWYDRGAAANGLEIFRWGWMFVEKVAPYDVICIEADEDMMAEGRRLAENALDVYRRAQETGEWPGCAPGLVRGRLLWSRYNDSNPTDAESLGLEGIE